AHHTERGGQPEKPRRSGILQPRGDKQRLPDRAPDPSHPRIHTPLTSWRRLWRVPLPQDSFVDAHRARNPTSRLSLAFPSSPPRPFALLRDLCVPPLPALPSAPMPLIVIGTIGIDTVFTPHGHREKVLGGSRTYLAPTARPHQA